MNTKKSEPSTRHIQFALEYFRTHNATEVCRKLGYKAPERAGDRLKKNKHVKKYLKQLDEIFDLRKLAKVDTDEITNKIASIEEVLEVLTRILRAEEMEETIVVLRNNTTTFEDGEKVIINEERIEKVPTKTKNSDRIKAGENLIRYYNDANKRNDESDKADSGVVILSEVKEL